MLKDLNVNLFIDIYTEMAFGKVKIKNIFPKDNDVTFLESNKDENDDLPFN